MENELAYAKLLDRDEDTFQQIIKDYSKLLWAVAGTIITSKTQTAVMDIEEVVSDTFVRFWQNPEKFKPEKGSLKNYLAVMTRSLAINKIKKNQRNIVSLFDDEVIETIQLPIEEQEWQALYDAIATLKEPTREIFIRRFFYNEKPSTIHQKMNLSSKQVDNFLYRGKKKLQETLDYQNFVEGILDHGE
ncbi:RNA polymerase sigma factor [Enterococcus sp. LJL99]